MVKEIPMRLSLLKIWFVTACLCVCAAVALAADCQNIGVPAYFYPSQPTSQWNTAVSDAPLPSTTARILIMNPSSGPGRSLNPDYVNAVSTVHAAGSNFLVFGYVYSKYGKRSLSAVERDIDKYYSWYAVDGIFIDETASAASYVSSYYQVLANYITAKKSGSSVMLNPGVYPDQSYLNISVPSNSLFIVNVFEDSYANYPTATVPSWAFSYPSSKFSHLVYSATSAQMSNAISLSLQRNVLWVYVTDLGLPNPWAGLPSYWSSLTALVKAGC